MKPIAASLAAALLLAPATVRADEATAWSRYERCVDGILDALHAAWRTGASSEGSRQRVNILCQGVTRDSTGGEGIMLPSWARSLITACSYVDELAGMNADTIWSANDLRANCSQMKKDAGDMLKARLVTVAPQAREKALHLGADLMFFYEGGCKRRRSARSVYHL